MKFSLCIIAKKNNGETSNHNIAINMVAAAIRINDMKLSTPKLHWGLGLSLKTSQRII